MPADTLTTFLLASALLALAPGPDNLFVLAQSALHGFRSGLLVTLGLCTGLVVHTLAVALGLAALFATSVLAFNMIRFAGAAYLLYLAWGAFTTRIDDTDQQAIPSLTPTALYLRGILMNLGNPKVVLFFLAFLPQFTRIDAGNITLQLLILGLLFIVVTLVIFSGIALLAARLTRALRASPAPRLWLNRLTGLLFTGLAVRLLLASR